MHTTHLIGAGALLAALGWFVSLPSAPTTGDSLQTSTPTPQAPPAPPVANGHLVFVVEGDRDQLTITHATAKVDAWGGIAKGATSAWTLTIHDVRGATLAEIPLDMAPFDTSADRKGGRIQVEGCIVRDPRIAMLVSAPRFAEAASYTFTRRADGAVVLLGTVPAARVQELVGGGR